jgi:hypothetical protein
MKLILPKLTPSPNNPASIPTKRRIKKLNLPIRFSSKSQRRSKLRKWINLKLVL